MNRTAKVMGLAAMMLLVPLLAFAQVDQFGATDTVYIDVSRIDPTNWTVTVSLTNDEYIEGLSVPLKLSAGKVRIVADSAVYTGGRVADFSYKGFRADTAIQCVTLGMVANMGPKKVTLPPGNGRLVTVFVSAMDGSPVEKLLVDSTTTNPNNTLMAVARRVQLTDPPDTTPVTESARLEIIPALVIRYE